MNWGIVFSSVPVYAEAALLTVRVALFGIVGALFAGICCAVTQHFRVPVARQLAITYIEISRNTPLLVQLFFLYYGLPKLGVKLDQEICAIIGLTFLGGSFMAETLRSGLDAVEPIQLQSSLSLGLTPWQATRRVILPQAVAISMPGITANLVFLVKETSVVSIIALPDLVFRAKEQIGSKYQTSEALLLLVVCYLLILLPVWAPVSWRGGCAVRRSGIELLLQGRNFLRLLEGLWVSASIALITMAFSIVLGIGLGIVMTSRNPVVKLFTRIYLEVVRIMPQIVLLFLVFFDLARYLGVNLDGQAAAIVVFTLWGTAEMGDLVRSAITSIPKHQYASAQALGLTPWQVQWHVVLPQAARRLLPTTINLTNRMIMTTPLVALIGVVEVLKVGQQIIDVNRFTHPDGALWIYGTVLIMYFVVCFPISWGARRLERKWATT